MRLFTDDIFIQLIFLRTLISNFITKETITCIFAKREWFVPKRLARKKQCRPLQEELAKKTISNSFVTRTFRKSSKLETPTTSEWPSFNARMLHAKAKIRIWVITFGAKFAFHRQQTMEHQSETEKPGNSSLIPHIAVAF